MPRRMRIPPPRALARACNFWPHRAAQGHAQGRENEGGQSDQARRGQNGHVQKGERDANGQGVDAGGNGQGEHGPQVQGGAAVFRLIGAGRAEHIAPQPAQQKKGDPVVNGRDRPANPAPKAQPAKGISP